MSPNIKDQPVHSILLLEDDSPMARLIERVLTRDGYQVRVESSARAGIDNIKRYGIPHAAVVDVHMPGLDLKRNDKQPGGLAFCQAVTQFCDIPIIIVTADNAVDRMLTFIHNYADDYIVKPFDPRELNARLRRILLRVGDYSYPLDPVIKVNKALQVNFGEQLIHVNGTERSLTPTESKLLFLLMKNKGQLVTADFLQRRLWNETKTPGDRKLAVNIARLRNKLPAREYIQTGRGIGYQFTPVLEQPTT
jgi:DNA-binding response OmpR family regulator